VSELIAYFDHDLMEKIMNNILSNAVKFTPDNGRIRVSLSVLKPRRQMSGRPGQQNPEFQIIVEDSGIGIPKGKTSKIFGRFYQVDDANNVSYTGSGVGLALTKKLVVLLDGSIDVTSGENKGSRFVMSFPLIVDSPSIDGKIENILLEEGISEFKRNISDNSVSKYSELESEEKLPLMLIVEDNSDMQRFLKTSFENQYRIIQAFNGKQGLEKALDNIPNIIISDVMMPEMDGIEFCNKIKNNDITNHVPIIMLTAKGSVESKLKGLEVGADSYIPKPFDMRILEMKVKKLLEDRDILREKFRLKGITQDSKKIGINNTHKTFLEKAEKIIEENLMNNEFGVEDLALALSFSRMQLYRKFKSILGSSANEFIRNYRIKKAAHLLIETDLNVSEILYDVGFTNRSYFSKCFKQSFDMSPKEYAKNIE
jgi:DNA-binding response OmpR family regulator